MAEDNFERVMYEVFKHEGGYVDHPADPGGATNMGVTFAVLQSWRGKPITKQDVKDLTQEEAMEIYKMNYWRPTKCGQLPAGVDLVMMDGAVNSGIARAPKWIQLAVGVEPDGRVGPMTIGAARDMNPIKIIDAALDARLNFLKRLKHWDTFGKGWGRRVESVREVAKEMAMGK
jgi:lysozyme family protein